MSNVAHLPRPYSLDPHMAHRPLSLTGRGGERQCPEV